MTDPTDPSGASALAAEYVLRLLDDAENEAFEARMTRDPTLRDLVHFWEDEFARLADDVPAVAPPAALRRRVLAAIALPKTRRRWVWGAGGALAAAALVGVLILTSVPRAGFDPALGASLGAPGGPVQIDAQVDLSRASLRLASVLGTPEEGRDFELWLIAAEGGAPISLGVIPRAAGRITLTEGEARLMPGGTLAISDEPQGGSPTGAPTGDILASAPLRQL